MADVKGIGRQISIGIAKETVRGTPESAASYWIPVAEADFNERIDLAQDEQSRGLIEESVGATKVRAWAELRFKAPLADKHFPLILLSILGSLSTADDPDSDASIKDHTVTVAQSVQHQALSLFIDDPMGQQDYKHGLGVCSGLEIAYETGKFMEYTANFMALPGATATLTPSYAAESRFVPKHLTVKFASALSGLDAASATVIKSLNLRFVPNVEPDDVLGNGSPADFFNKNFTIEGTLEATWQNESDFKTAFLAQTAKAMRIDLKNTDVTIGSAANPQIRIDLAKVIFSELTRPIRINDVVRQTLGFKAHYSTSDSKLITVLCVNAIASY